MWVRDSGEARWPACHVGQRKGSCESALPSSGRRMEGIARLCPLRHKEQDLHCPARFSPLRCFLEAVLQATRPRRREGGEK